MAYATVASLMRTMESVLASNSPMQSLISDHREEFLALQGKVSFLEVFLKNFEKSSEYGEVIDFEAEIKEVANVVEHTIQLRLTEAVMANDKMQKENAHERFYDSLQQVAEDIGSVYQLAEDVGRVHKESTKLQDKGKQVANISLAQDFSSSAKDILNVKNNMVGRNDERERMLTKLTKGSSSELKVIPIVGMGGIGKTSLAKEVFNDLSVQSHFDYRAWATMAKEYCVKDILVSLLCSTKEKEDNVYRKDEAEIADMLQKRLKGKRYLIVMDDMWSIKAWDDVRLCFPRQDNGSRVVLTTRNTEVACYAGTEKLPLQMGFMDSNESWYLFKSTVFPDEELPLEFEKIGKQIVDKCQGLPLTIVVVAGLLRKSKMTIEDWEDVAKNVKSFVTNDPDEQCLHVLGLSYNHLTSDLKACLLYFGVFPEDTEISAQRLMRLWSAEGFLKLENDLDGEAERCLQDLIDRCLVLVCKKSLDETKIRSCKVHDLIYELCLSETRRQQIFIMNNIVFDDEPNPVPSECHQLSRLKLRPSTGWTNDDIDHGFFRALLTPGHHHLVRGQTDVDDDNNPLKRTRSIFYFGRDSPTSTLISETSTLISELIHVNLLRILDLSGIGFRIFPPQILCLIWLRYLVLKGRFCVPPEISKLWNLQTLIVHGNGMRSVAFPEQIWELMKLRHLRLSRFYLPNPPCLSVDGQRYFFSNIRYISALCPSSCTKEVISGIRNVKKINISGDRHEYESFQKSRLLDNLALLHQLETLKLSVVIPGVVGSKISLVTIPSAKALPSTLRKLTLSQTSLRWKELNVVGELPNLEVLKLRYWACKGEEWYPFPGGFKKLKLLLIEGSELKYWKATDDNFPVLERLLIRICLNLEELPIEFANIQSLQLIGLRGCKPELEASAVRIQQEQEDLGNKPVDVRRMNGSIS